MQFHTNVSKSFPLVSAFIHCNNLLLVAGHIYCPALDCCTTCPLTSPPLLSSLPATTVSSLLLFAAAASLQCVCCCILFIVQCICMSHPRTPRPVSVWVCVFAFTPAPIYLLYVYLFMSYIYQEYTYIYVERSTNWCCSHCCFNFFVIFYWALAALSIAGPSVCGRGGGVGVARLRCNFNYARTNN